MPGRPQATNAIEIRVVGMSRSGNHAIIDWILAQARGRTCFLNCAEPKTNPFESARPIDDDRPGYRANYRGFDVGAERAGRFSRKDLLVHSYEDTFLGSLRHPDAVRRRDEFLGRSARRFDVLILRDPFNLFASRLASGVGEVTLGTAGRIWAQHAREFLGVRRYLGHDRMRVSYNAWASSRAYRERVAEQLGLRFDDAAAESVAVTASGSSFDGMRYDGRAHDMALFDRWRLYTDDPVYLSAITDDMVELSERIFGRVAEEPPESYAEAA